jgi:hypothetical protein
MKRAVASILAIVFLFTSMTACAGKDEGSPIQKQESDTPVTAPAEQSGVSSGAGWEGLFTYDDTQAVQFTVKAAIPNEEDAYEYPWGDYDAYDTEKKSAPEKEIQDMDEDELERQLEETLAAAEAGQAAQAQQDTTDPKATRELPPDWYAESNLPALGGRLEFASGASTVILEMSEYCVEADTTFTVTPVKTTVLADGFFKGGFSLRQEGKTDVSLKDYAIITFLTRDDPGEDVVIKSFGENGRMEYAWADVARSGDIFMITGAVEHFSTVGYGSAAPEQVVTEGPISQESHELLIRKSKELSEQMQREKAQQKAAKKFVRTIEFDEILYTTSAADLPLQLHLRAKLVEQPATLNKETGNEEITFKGKIWLKFYTWAPGGYGNIYMICNNALLRDPPFWVASLGEQGLSTFSTTLNMLSTGGSIAVAEGAGSADISGKSYTDVQTEWTYMPANDTIKVTFTSMKGAKEKTFVTGRLSAKTQRQANKKLKWFLD